MTSIVCLRRNLFVSFLAVTLLAGTAGNAMATHLRGVTVSWAPTATPGEVRFTLLYAQRWTYPSTTNQCNVSGACPALNSIVSLANSNGSFNFGDGSPAFNATGPVTSINQAEDWFVATMTFTHIYSGCTVRTAFYQGTNRISTVKLGHDQIMHMETTVNPCGGNSPPVSSMPAIVSIPLQPTTGFNLGAAVSDPNADPVTFRLSTTIEMYNSGSVPCPNNVASNGQPPGLSISQTTGQVTWTLASITSAGCGLAAPVAGDLWTVQFMVEDRDVNGAVKSKVPVDLILKFVATVGTPPTLVLNPIGPISVAAGTPVSFTATGNDVDANARVTLNATGIPSGATASNLNQQLIPPVTSTFNWTPQIGQGGTYVITYSATDDTFQQTLKSITITVEDNVAPTLTCATPITTQYNVAGTLSVQVADANGDALTVVWKVDATTVQTDTTPATKNVTTVTLTTTYGAVGDHTVAISATDPKSASVSCSTTVTVTKADQTINFAALPDRTYGDGPLTLSATASSGLAVSFSLQSGPASLTGNSLSLTGIGLVTVVASQAGNANYSPAPDVPQAFSVLRALLTVTAKSASRAYGSANPDLSAPLSITGFVLGEGASIITTSPTCSTGATTTSPVAPYPVTCSGGAATNYSFSYTAGTLTVTKAVLTVTADDKSRLYGAANPAFTATYSGFVNNENASVLTGSPALSTAAVATSPVGPYAIVAAAGSLTVANYSFSFVNGTLTVNRATLTVTATNKSRTYGAPNPTFTSTYSGFANGDTGSVLTGAPAFSTTATAGSGVGTYPITPAIGTLSAVNYTFAFVDGTLTITKATLTVKADDTSRPYGMANPTFTASFTGFVNGDMAAGVVTGVPALSTAATAASGAGTYPITTAVGTLTATNYDFSFINGTLTITKASLTVTADDKVKVYGAPLPTLTVSYSGFVNGDGAGSLGGALNVTTTATAGSPVAAYAITASGYTSSNYNIAYLPGTLQITTAALTVTADNKMKVYGASLPTLTASYSGFVNGDGAGSLGGALSLTTTATAASPVDSYPITASGYTSQNYTIGYLPGTLTVTRATLTVTADNKMKVYGAPLPILTVSYSGLVNGDGAGSLGGTLSVSTTATAASAVNTYPITASGYTSPNYNIGYTPGVLTITKATLTVVADNKTKSYGAPLPALTVSYSGFVNGDGAGSLGGVLIVSTTATAASPVSTYPITASGYTSSNYMIGYTPGALQITRATLTVTANDQTRVYGAPLPTLSAIISGFVNSDTISAVTGAPALATSATAASGVGPYPIAATIGSLAAANYDFTFGNGTLTVTKAVLTVAADNKSKTYGAAVPALTATIAGFVNGDTVSAVGGATALWTAATTGSPVGAYTITAAAGTLSAANYSFSFTNGTLTVNKAVLTVGADNKSKVFGAANPVLTASYGGFVNGDTGTVLSGAPALATSATTASGFGTYPITAGLGSLSAVNYDFTFVNGALTVTKAVLTVTADNKSKVYGTANPALTASYSGFVNGDTAAVVSGTAALSTTVTNASGVGTYPITAAPGGLSAVNYSFSFVNGTLTVTKATLTVTAVNQTSQYSDPLPLLTSTTTGFVGSDTVAAISGSPNLTTTATSSSAANSYPISVDVSAMSAANYMFVGAPGVLVITLEDTTIDYSGDTLKTTSGTQSNSTASVTLAAVIKEAADGYLGTKLNTTQVQFTVFKFTDATMTTPVATCTGAVTSTGPGTGAANCVVALGEDNFIVRAEQVTNGYYTAPVETEAVTVVQPGTGMTAGGGWLTDPTSGLRSNLGFTVKYLKNGNIQGNSLYIYRKTIAPNSVPLNNGYLPAGVYNWIIKSNSMGGLTMACSTTTPAICTASFSGKNNITAVNRQTGSAYSLGGNYNFQVDVTDNGEPGSGATSPDQYAVRIWDTSTGTYYQLGSAANQLQLLGGNIQVKP